MLLILVILVFIEPCASTVQDSGNRDGEGSKEMVCDHTMQPWVLSHQEFSDKLSRTFGALSAAPAPKETISKLSETHLDIVTHLVALRDCVGPGEIDPEINLAYREAWVKLAQCEDQMDSRMNLFQAKVPRPVDFVSYKAIANICEQNKREIADLEALLCARGNATVDQCDVSTEPSYAIPLPPTVEGHLHVFVEALREGLLTMQQSAEAEDAAWSQENARNVLEAYKNFTVEAVERLRRAKLRLASPSMISLDDLSAPARLQDKDQPTPPTNAAPLFVIPTPLPGPPPVSDTFPKRDHEPPFPPQFNPRSRRQKPSSDDGIADPDAASWQLNEEISKTTARIIAIGCVVLFAITVGLGIYHSGDCS